MVFRKTACLTRQGKKKEAMNASSQVHVTRFKLISSVKLTLADDLVQDRQLVGNNRPDGLQ